MRDLKSQLYLKALFMLLLGACSGLKAQLPIQHIELQFGGSLFDHENTFSHSQIALNKGLVPFSKSWIRPVLATGFQFGVQINRYASGETYAGDISEGNIGGCDDYYDRGGFFSVEIT